MNGQPSVEIRNVSDRFFSFFSFFSFPIFFWFSFILWPFFFLLCSEWKYGDEWKPRKMQKASAERIVWFPIAFGFSSSSFSLLLFFLFIFIYCVCVKPFFLLVTRILLLQLLLSLFFTQWKSENNKWRSNGPLRATFPADSPSKNVCVEAN